MKKILVIPDSFKGTLSSSQIVQIVSEVLEDGFSVTGYPVGDGGEGTEEAFHSALGGTFHYLETTGPLGEKMNVRYLRIGEKAVIEMASCAGLPLVKGRENPLETTTYGVGEMILDAAKNGCNDIMVGLGGSCTNDGGCGLASALGVRFLDEDGKQFVPTGGSLTKICRVEKNQLMIDPDTVRITGICDVKNPLYGPNGAAYVYGPQKGADGKDVIILDEGLRHLAEICRDCFGHDKSSYKGAGAAGGCGYGLMTFLGASLSSGIETVLKVMDYRNIVRDYDYVITGEGRIDSQSFSGKVIQGVLEASQGVPVIAIAGKSLLTECECRSKGLYRAYWCLDKDDPVPDTPQLAEMQLRKLLQKVRDDLK